MTHPGCGSRAHTEIVSEKQRGLFGATLARRREHGGKGGMPGITTEELRGHLQEAKGKKLPQRSRPGREALRKTVMWR